MKNFSLDSRLAKDCLVLGRMNISMLLLMNNSLVPWFILVPKTSEKEIYDLSSADQVALMQEINTLSAFIKDNFDITKLNVASIGNIVSQLHVHVVGRNISDYCWPGVVWGASEIKPYNDAQVSKITTDLRDQLGEKFT
ncbi:HIT domain-containing protein [Gammaproteobacteria bacterium]|nr:HIT domain-containing protein [Gammaproteobacteria bacterium]